MKKMTKKVMALGLCIVSMGGTVVPVMAAPTSVQQSIGTVIPSKTMVTYSALVAGDGAVNINFDLQGVKLTTSDPYKFSDNLTQNYDICISEGTSYTKDSFSINVNWSNPGVEYVGDWVININGSMFTDGQDRQIVIKVLNDLGQVGAPKIKTNVDQGVTRQQLTQGFDLEMEMTGAKFNTTCFGNYIRQSMMNSCGIRGLYPVAYCNALQPNKVKLRVQAPNGVESWRTHFEFKIEGNATNSPVPITVRIPIIK
ncbi:MAG: hypothetical protein ACRCW2_15875 [Cellulosilyticaceae bacterium]